MSLNKTVSCGTTAICWRSECCVTFLISWSSINIVPYRISIVCPGIASILFKKSLSVSPGNANTIISPCSGLPNGGAYYDCDSGGVGGTTNLEDSFHWIGKITGTFQITTKTYAPDTFAKRIWFHATYQSDL